MGRFYKSTKGNYLDFMYQQPSNMLLKAQQVADQSLAQQEMGYDTLYQKLQMNKLSADDELSKKIISDYEGIIDEKTTDLRENALKYINNPGELSKVSKEIWKDKTRGTWAAIESNYATRQTYKQKLDKMVEAFTAAKGEAGISQSHADALLNKFDADFSKFGTKGEAGDMSGAYQTGFVSDAIIGTNEVDKAMKGTNINTYLQNVGSGVTVEETPEGKLTFLESGSKKELTETEVNNIIVEYINANPVINEYFGTRQAQGIPGFLSEQVLAKKQAMIDYGISKYAYEEQEATKKKIGDTTGSGSGSSDGTQINSTSRGLEITSDIGSYVDPVTPEGAKNSDAYDANNKPISGTYSGTLLNIKTEAEDLVEYDQTLDLKHNSAQEIASATLGDDSGVNYTNQLFEAKSESQRTGNWDGYKKEIEKVNEDYAEKALAKWEADNINKTYKQVNDKKAFFKANPLIKLTDNDIAQFGKYNESYVTTRENNIAKIKGLTDRTNDNLQELDRIKNDILAGNSDYDILTEDYHNIPEELKETLTLQDRWDKGMNLHEDHSKKKKALWQERVKQLAEMKATVSAKNKIRVWDPKARGGRGGYTTQLMMERGKGFWPVHYIEAQKIMKDYDKKLDKLDADYAAGAGGVAYQNQLLEKEKLQRNLQAEMKQATKANPELQRLLNTNIVSNIPFQESYVNGVGSEMNSAYSHISQTFVDPGGSEQMDYEGASKWLNKNLFGTTVGYLNQSDNINKTKSTRTNTPIEILPTKTDSKNETFVNDQTKQNFRNWLHDRVYDGKKISINKVKDNLGTKIKLLANKYDENSPLRTVLTNFDNLTQDMITEQVAVKQVTEGQMNELTNETAVNTIGFVSNGVPVNFYISSPMVTETVIDGQPGMHLVYDIEIGVNDEVKQYYNKAGEPVKENSPEVDKSKTETIPEGTVRKHTITQTLGPDVKGANYDAMTDAISPERYNKHMKKFSQTAPFAIAKESIESQTKSNSSSNLIMKVPNSTFVHKGNNKKYMTVTKVENGQAVFYVVPFQSLTNFTDHAELDKLIKATPKEDKDGNIIYDKDGNIIYKDGIKPASIQGINNFYTARTNFVD